MKDKYFSEKDAKSVYERLVPIVDELIDEAKALNLNDECTINIVIQADTFANIYTSGLAADYEDGNCENRGNGWIFYPRLKPMAIEVKTKSTFEELPFE